MSTTIEYSNCSDLALIDLMEGSHTNLQLVPAEDRHEVHTAYLEALHEFQRRLALRYRYCEGKLSPEAML